MHLRRSSFLGLERLLLIALDHDHAQETAHDSTADKEEDDGNANGPDARRKELLDWVRVVDEWLGWELVLACTLEIESLQYTMSSVQMV